ncbi:MAG: hypothetical protein EOP84_09560 [Verrucomicrobiaceae bacterium]|nr:MAG: hypothetical protein EOP84_09560 [Verrucomicrobiaceae bacterium]
MKTIHTTEINPFETEPKLSLVCSKHGPQARVILKGLETQDLILGCGCAFELGSETPHHCGNLHDGSYTYAEAQELFCMATGVEVPPDEYFHRLATIGHLVPDMEQYNPEDVTHTLHTADGVFTRKGTEGAFARGPA